MTNEEAIKNIKDFIGWFKKEDKPIYKALEMAIKTLEQEPCDDAVSRQAVIEIIDEEWLCNAEYEFRPLVEAIEKLPSVRPQKSGKWLPTYGNVQCSVCGGVQDGKNVGKATLYCCYCGARMFEPQESEEV